ncbi:hypothetical protein ACFX11_030159 [Malus domestica]
MASWKFIEDVTLCEYGVQITHDPITGNEMQLRELWSRNTIRFCKRLGKDARSNQGLQGRWKKNSTNCLLVGKNALSHAATNMSSGRSLVGQDPAYYLLKEGESPSIFGSIEKQRWSYACAKQLIERQIYAEGAENGLEFTIVKPFNWIGPRMDFIPGIDGPSEGVPRVLACFSNNLLRREPLKLVDGGQSQRTFVYIKDVIKAVMLMIVSEITNLF